MPKFKIIDKCYITRGSVDRIFVVEADSKEDALEVFSSPSCPDKVAVENLEYEYETDEVEVIEIKEKKGR